MYWKTVLHAQPSCLCLFIFHLLIQVYTLQPNSVHTPIKTSGRVLSNQPVCELYRINGSSGQCQLYLVLFSCSVNIVCVTKPTVTLRIPHDALGSVCFHCTLLFRVNRISAVLSDTDKPSTDTLLLGTHSLN